MPVLTFRMSVQVCQTFRYQAVTERGLESTVRECLLEDALGPQKALRLLLTEAQRTGEDELRFPDGFVLGTRAQLPSDEAGEDFEKRSPQLSATNVLLPLEFLLD